MNGNMKTALTALTDALAELPAEDILFTSFAADDWSVNCMNCWSSDTR